MRSHVHFCSVFSFFAAFCFYYAQAQMCREHEYHSNNGRCLPCAGCPPGEEPDRKCGFGEGLGMICKRCSTGAFSASHGPELCASHTRCEDKKRVLISPGTAVADALCGGCIPGYYSPEGDTDPRTNCLPCASAPKDMPRCPGSRKGLTRLTRNAEASHRRDDKPPLNGTREGKPEENATQYAVLAIVPVFCVMGLLGILFCNLLMKKGYHCTAQKDEEGAKAEKNGNSSAYRIEDANEDTIGVLVRLITEKKENAAVLEEMLKDYHTKELMQPVYKPVNKLQLLPQIPHICRHQHHLHTVQGLATRSGPTCTRCSQRKWPEVLLSPEAAAAASAAAANTTSGTITKPAKPGSKAGRPGEITLLSVGRFRVARIPEQKPSPSEVKTISESAEAKPTEPLYACLVPEQKQFVGNTVRPKWVTTGDGQQEDSPLIVRLGETNLVI